MNMQICRCFITCTVLFVACTNWTLAQIAKGDSLLSQEKYTQAALAYERAIFRHQGNDSIKAVALLAKARCQKNTQQYAKALATLQRIPSHELAKLPIAQYEMALNAFLAGKYRLVNTQVAKAKDLKTSSVYPSLLFLDILSHHALAEWDSGRVSAIEYAHLTGDHFHADSIYAFVKRVKLKDPLRAERLSIIPGLGQLYAGYPAKAFISASLQGLFAGYATLSFIEGYYASGLLSGVGMFGVFYRGGAKHAHHLAEQKNQQRIQAVNQRLHQALLQIESQRLSHKSSR